MNWVMKELGLHIEYERWNKQDRLPLYIADSYQFQLAIIEGHRCIVLSPTEELVTMPALRKQIQKVQEIENIPVVIKLPWISSYRRNSLLQNKIPFMTKKQVYFPFIYAYLTNENQEQTEIKKFMFSTQLLVLLYLYGNSRKLYMSDITTQLPFSAMTVSRAVKQLELVGLFKVTKDGVCKVIEADYDHRELFQRLKGYLSTPVCKVGYIEKKNVTEEMVFAGETVLAEETRLNPNRVMTYAVYGKEFDKRLLMNELVDPKQQVRLELWEYNPRQFSDGKVADKLSVALSFLETKDERIEEAVEQLVESVWEE